MSESVSRRDFLAASTAMLALGHAPSTFPGDGPPAILRARAAPTVAVSSFNGLAAIARAVELADSGADSLDAVVEGIKLQELDPEDESAGYGGLPNEEGVVQLDASCIHGPTGRAGAVAALEGIRTPSEVAKLVLKYTNHTLLVGQGAKRFALSYGFKEEDLLTERSRRKWLTWRANHDAHDDWTEDGMLASGSPGAVYLSVVNTAGDIASATSASGPAWKAPGCAGTSPVAGAVQYVDNDVGAAGSSGLGEPGMMECGGFITVEHMRRGMRPTDAALETLKRIVAKAPARFLMRGGLPRFSLTLYAVNKRGEFGAASLYPGRYAAHDGRRAAERDSAYLYDKAL